ncbi:MAG TPA: putative DNA modification/repair radical SAM protein, partial [Accumulibacter sp.]|nr:putative DNA modification/repair radical SAM protein [Accumulibacter sp.]
RAAAQGVGNGMPAGLCHSFTEDGRCVSLLKILLSNHCIYDCAYCVSRHSNDIPRAAFTVEEIVDLTLNFYRRNYIEGLFLSSGVFKNPDYTMERMVKVARSLRLDHDFHGYIHLKIIPKASPELVHEAGLHADRLSINMEIPTVSGLRRLAPEKTHADIIQPMDVVQHQIVNYRDSARTIKSTPAFAPAGQSSQLIIGAAQETDWQVLRTADQLYRRFALKRVYYSGYVPMLTDERLPDIHSSVPSGRENRLYQADWLMRFYGYQAGELLAENQPFLDLEIDPKLSWAMRHLDQFPVAIQSAPLEMILRIPGVGVKSAHKIVVARRFQPLTLEHLRQMGAAVNRARYFVVTAGGNPHLKHLTRENLLSHLSASSQIGKKMHQTRQLSLF